MFFTSGMTFICAPLSVPPTMRRASFPSPMSSLLLVSRRPPMS